MADNDTIARGAVKESEEKVVELVRKNLKKRKIDSEYVATRQEAVELLLKMIPEGKSVGSGNSQTQLQIGIWDALKKRGKNELFLPYEVDEEGRWLYSFAEQDKLRKAIFGCDIYLCGINAITRNGEIVNVDNLGNRVAPAIYGPDKVIFITGVNKICKDMDAAWNRARELCAPKTARLLGYGQGFGRLLKLPCVQTGQCYDCSNEARMCNFMVTIGGNSDRYPGRISVVIIGEDLGF